MFDRCWMTIFHNCVDTIVLRDPTWNICGTVILYNAYCMVQKLLWEEGD